MNQPAKSPQPKPPTERSGTLIEPGGNPPSGQPGRPKPVERFGTLIETEDDVRLGLQTGQKGRPRGPAGPSELSPAPVPMQRRGASRGAVSTNGAAAGRRVDGV